MRIRAGEARLYTVVIASRIGDPLLVQAMSSIATQTLAPEAILVVCDPNAAIPRDWADSACRAADGVEIVRAPRPGMVAALNHGIIACNTPHVAFLDTDDLWLPEKQERQVRELDHSPHLDAVTCQAANLRIDTDGAQGLDAPTPAGMFTCTTFRRRTFDAFGLLDPTATHFTWLYRWWGLAREKGITTTCVDYVGLHRRVHAGNSWRQHREVAHRDLLNELRIQIQRRRT